MTENLGEGLKKIMLAGIGAVATTADKSEALLKELVSRGELTAEQGKVLNQELKHTVKDKMKDHVSVSVTTSDVEKLSANLDKLSAEDLALLKQKVDEAQAKADTAKDE